MEGWDIDIMKPNNMTPYSETQGKPFIDWNERVNRKPETVTEEEWEQWAEDAGTWVTCACGNLCDLIPRDKDTGMPLDKRLFNLGTDFFTVMCYKALDLARSILAQIEQRSAHLIAEINETRTH
jgi:hypothetical protein